MGLNEQLAREIDFSKPGILREKITDEGFNRYHGISTMVASVAGQLEDVSYLRFQQALADRMNAFLREHLATAMEFPTQTMLAEQDDLILKSAHIEFHIKLFLAIGRTENAIASFFYAVHPEEMDLLMRIAYGPAYEHNFGAID